MKTSACLPQVQNAGATVLAARVSEGYGAACFPATLGCREWTFAGLQRVACTGAGSFHPSSAKRLCSLCRRPLLSRSTFPPCGSHSHRRGSFHAQGGEEQYLPPDNKSTPEKTREVAAA